VMRERLRSMEPRPETEDFAGGVSCGGGYAIAIPEFGATGEVRRAASGLLPRFRKTPAEVPIVDRGAATSGPALPTPRDVEKASPFRLGNRRRLQNLADSPPPLAPLKRNETSTRK